MSGDGWAEHVEFLRSPPPDDGLARMAEAVCPGSTVVRWRRLHGGLGAAACVVELAPPGGASRRVVLKRFMTVRGGAVEEHRRLQIAHQHLGPIAPAPLGVDAAGAWFGGSALVMGWVDGHTTLDHDRADWPEQMGAAIAVLHRSSQGTPGADAVPARTVDDFAGSFEVATGSGPWKEVVDVARAALPALLGGELTLVHGDYHPGNLLWRDGRVAGIVDWENLTRSHALEDLGCGRVDVLLTHGRAQSERLRRGYEAAIGGPVDEGELAVWDLVAAARARRFGHLWLTSFHESGRPEMTREMIYRRLRRFARDRLEAASDSTAFRH